MIYIALVVSHAAVAAAFYIVGVNRNRAAAKAEIEAIEAKVGEQGKAWLAALKARLGL